MAAWGGHPQAGPLDLLQHKPLFRTHIHQRGTTPVAPPAVDPLTDCALGPLICALGQGDEGEEVLPGHHSLHEVPTREAIDALALHPGPCNMNDVQLEPRVSLGLVRPKHGVR